MFPPTGRAPSASSVRLDRWVPSHLPRPPPVGPLLQPPLVGPPQRTARAVVVFWSGRRLAWGGEVHCSGSLSPNHFILRDLQSTPVRWKGAESENLDYLDTSMYSFTVWCSRATIKSTPRLREPEERENRDALALQPGAQMKWKWRWTNH